MQLLLYAGPFCCHRSCLAWRLTRHQVDELAVELGLIEIELDLNQLRLKGLRVSALCHVSVFLVSGTAVRSTVI